MADREALLALLRGAITRGQDAAGEKVYTGDDRVFEHVATQVRLDIMAMATGGHLAPYGVAGPEDLELLQVTAERHRMGVDIQIHVHGTPLAAALERNIDEEITDVETPTAKARERSKP